MTAPRSALTPAGCRIGIAFGPYVRTGTAGAFLPAHQADARVDDGVGKIDDQVQCDDGEREEDHG